MNRSTLQFFIITLAIVVGGIWIGVRIGARWTGTSNTEALSATQSGRDSSYNASERLNRQEDGSARPQTSASTVDEGPGMATSTPSLVPMRVVEDVDGYALDLPFRVASEPVIVRAQVISIEPAWFNAPGGATPSATMDPDPRNDLAPEWDVFTPVVFSVSHVYRGIPTLTRLVTSVRGGTTSEGDVLEVNGRSDSGFTLGSTYMLFAANRLKPGRPAGLQDWQVRALDLQDSLIQAGQSAQFLMIDSWCRYDGSTAYCPNDAWNITVQALESQVDALTP